MKINGQRYLTARFDQQVEAYEFAAKKIDESTNLFSTIVPMSIHVRQMFWGTDFIVSWWETP